MTAHQIMPADELLSAQEVHLTVSLSASISRHGHRVICEKCGADIINEREVSHRDQALCRTCAGDTYYTDAQPVFLAKAHDKMIERKLTPDYLTSTIHL